MVDVSIDGESTKLVFASSDKVETVRAKRQIHLKLTTSSSASGLVFSINGQRIIPGWHVTDHKPGTLGMFDAVEATISSDMLNQPSPKDQHKIGESFQDWISQIQIDRPTICRQNKPACKSLQNIEKKGSGLFYTTDNVGRVFGWSFSDGKLASIKTQ